MLITWVRATTSHCNYPPPPKKKKKQKQKQKQDTDYKYLHAFTITRFSFVQQDNVN